MNSVGLVRSCILSLFLGSSGGSCANPEALARAGRRESPDRWRKPWISGTFCPRQSRRKRPDGRRTEKTNAFVLRLPVRWLDAEGDNDKRVRRIRTIKWQHAVNI